VSLFVDLLWLLQCKKYAVYFSILRNACRNCLNQLLSVCR